MLLKQEVMVLIHLHGLKHFMMVIHILEDGVEVEVVDIVVEVEVVEDTVEMEVVVVLVYGGIMEKHINGFLDVEVEVEEDMVVMEG